MNIRFKVKKVNHSIKVQINQNTNQQVFILTTNKADLQLSEISYHSVTAQNICYLFNSYTSAIPC